MWPYFKSENGYCESLIVNFKRKLNIIHWYFYICKLLFSVKVISRILYIQAVAELGQAQKKNWLARQANVVIFLWGCLPLMSFSIEVFFYWCCLPLRLFSIEFVFHWGRLPLRSFCIEVIFHWGCLPLRLSSIEVVFHWGLVLLRLSY